MTFTIILAIVFYVMKSETSIYKLCDLIRQNEQTKSHQRIFAVSDDLWKIKCDSTREYSPQAHINVSANYCINIFWIQSQMGYQLSSWCTQDVFTHHSRFSLFFNFLSPINFLGQSFKFRNPFIFKFLQFFPFLYNHLPLQFFLNSNYIITISSSSLLNKCYVYFYSVQHLC